MSGGTANSRSLPFSIRCSAGSFASIVVPFRARWTSGSAPRYSVTSTRASNLLQHAAVHDRDPVAHRHRLDRDVDRRRPQAPLKLEGLDAQLRIQVRERLSIRKTDGSRTIARRARRADAGRRMWSVRSSTARAVEDLALGSDARTLIPSPGRGHAGDEVPLRDDEKQRDRNDRGHARGHPAATEEVVHIPSNVRIVTAASVRSAGGSITRQYVLK